MSKRQRRLLRSIQCAFAGVELGDGVSLHETILLDNYGDPRARRAARAADEKHDWRKLVDDPELERVTGVGGMGFLDAAGLRFHLPAYLCLTVRYPRWCGNILQDLLFLLTCPEHRPERFALLNRHRRACIRDVLLYLRCANAIDDDPALDRSIWGYWSAAPTPEDRT